MSFTRVQTKNANTVAATFAAPVGSGNTVVGLLSYDNASGPLTTITDDKGNSYTIIDNILDANNQHAVSFALGNITNGPVTITANGGVTSFPQIIIDEFSGADTVTNNRDGHTGQAQASPGTGTDAITSTAITTTQAGDLIWGATMFSDIATLPSVGTGFALSGSENAGGYAMRTEYLTQGAAGSIAATFTTGTNTHATTLIVAIKALGVASNSSRITQAQQAVKRAFYW